MCQQALPGNLGGRRGDGKPSGPKLGARTANNFKLVDTAFHGCVIIPTRELAELWQASSAHPNHESWIFRNVGEVVLIVSFGVPIVPIRRGMDVFRGVLCLAIQRLVGLPGNVGLVLHFVGFHVLHVEGAADAIIEEGVCNQATRIVWLSSLLVHCQRRASRAVDSRGAQRFAPELSVAEGGNVTTVVLVEVSEVVVEQYRRTHRFRDFELDVAVRHVGVFALVRLIYLPVGPHCIGIWRCV